MNPYYIREYSDRRHTKVIMVPIFEDNYVYLLTDNSKNALIVDPGIAEPVVDVIEELGLNPSFLLITHSHPDHIGGVPFFQNKYPEIKKIDFSSCKNDSERFELEGYDFSVFKTPGHLDDHICFFETRNQILFCGDVLFRFGCGRIFKGSFDEVFQSMQKLKALPIESDVYCTHEYTKANLAFCIKNGLVNPLEFSREEKMLIESIPSLPVRLRVELKYNPFLRAGSVDQLAQIRKRRNDFKS